MKKIFLVLVTVVFVIGSSSVFQSCDNEFDSNIADYPYLSLNDNFDIEKLSSEEQEIFYQAFQRMKIEKVDALYQTRFNFSSQINISENLFDYFINVMNSSNQCSGVIKNTTPRLKNGSENGNGTPAENACVAQTMIRVLKSFGSPKTYNEVDYWITSNYGSGGVPFNKMNEVCLNYFTGQNISYEAAAIKCSQPADIYTAGNKYIVIVRRSGSSEGHAGRILSIMDAVVFFEDVNGQQMAYREEVMSIFEATGIR